MSNNIHFNIGHKWMSTKLTIALLSIITGCGVTQEPVKRDDTVPFTKMMLGAQCSNDGFSRCMGFQSNRDCEDKFEKVVDDCVADVEPPKLLDPAESLALSKCYEEALNAEKLYLPRQEVCKMVSSGRNKSATVFSLSDKPSTQVQKTVKHRTDLEICGICHDKGVAKAPKTGDIEAWRKLREKGFEVLLLSVMNGKGKMPARAGTNFTDAQLISTLKELAGY